MGTHSDFVPGPKPAPVSYKRLKGLTVPQRNAIDLLAAGLTDPTVARRIGVSRTTVTKWRLYDPLFKAELDRVRHVQWAAARDVLSAVVPTAIGSIRQQLTFAPNRGRLALDLITRAGVMGRPYSGALSQIEESAGDAATTVEGVLDSRIRRVRQQVAAQVGVAESPLGPVLAPITDAERDAAMQLLLSLAEGPDAADAGEPAGVTPEDADRLLIDVLRGARATTLPGS